jgi:hypothetical protein
MRLSGHSYNNDVFDSLLNNLPGKIIYREAQQKQEQGPISGMDIFSSKTEDTMSSVQEERLQFIAKELDFAAERAHVAISNDDFVRFASQVIDSGLRGKKLERAAQRFCNELGRESAAPQGATRNNHSSELLNEFANNHAVIPAGYNPEHGQNNTRTGGYMGMSKNPNTIWDSGKLAEFAQKKHGDEQIKESREAQQQFRHDQKVAFWQDLQEKLSDPDVIQGKVASVANVSTREAAGGNQRLPANSMSMFSNDRDFENIPEQTAGEKLAQLANDRATKKADAQFEWNKIASATKADNSLSSLFSKDEPEVPTQRQSTHRAAVDRIFEGLINQGLGK